MLGVRAVEITMSTQWSPGRLPTAAPRSLGHYPELASQALPAERGWMEAEESRLGRLGMRREAGNRGFNALVGVGDSAHLRPDSTEVWQLEQSWDSSTSAASAELCPDSKEFIRDLSPEVTGTHVWCRAGTP